MSPEELKLDRILASGDWWTFMTEAPTRWSAALDEVKRLQARVKELEEAMRPFAGLAEIFDHDSGTRPKTGIIVAWSDHRVGDLSLTVEMLRAALGGKSDE